MNVNPNAFNISSGGTAVEVYIIVTAVTTATSDIGGSDSIVTEVYL